MDTTNVTPAPAGEQSVTKFPPTAGNWISDGERVYTDDPHEGSSNGVLICEVCPVDYFGKGMRWMFDAESRANSRLIAAAPDLLAALARLLNVAILQGADMDEGSAIQQARAAFAKAKGL